MTLWGNKEFTFAIAEPFDENPASNGNGTMLGFQVDSIEKVNRLHNKALDLGGVSEGEPRIRSNMYSAYVRDLDKNKICFYTIFLIYQLFTTKGFNIKGLSLLQV